MIFSGICSQNEAVRSLAGALGSSNAGLQVFWNDGVGSFTAA